MNILAPTRYPWTFNGPRQSKHNIIRRNFLPLNKISQKIEGFTVINPIGYEKIDAIHAFNRIPITLKPYIIGFESHLPRAFGFEKTKYYEVLTKALLNKRCRGIFAISKYASKHFISSHRDKPWYDELKSKLNLRYPNIEIPKIENDYDKNFNVFKVIFIGNHFFRKGGASILKLAEIAKIKKIPIEVTIISSFQYGSCSWVDPLNESYFDRYKNLLNSLDNVKIFQSLPNPHVLDLLRVSHLSALPTFSDTFGFSVIESMINYIPAVTTTRGALTEFIEHKRNGVLIPLDINNEGEWIHINHGDRSSKKYEDLFEDQSNSIAESMALNIIELINNQAMYFNLREEARSTAIEFFSSQDANNYWDDVYENL